MAARAATASERVRTIMLMLTAWWVEVGRWEVEWEVGEWKRVVRTVEAHPGMRDGRFACGRDEVVPRGCHLW